jgi:hypothetical protein
VASPKPDMISEDNDGAAKLQKESYLEQPMPVMKIGDQQTEQETTFAMKSEPLPVLFRKKKSIPFQES